MTVAFLMAAKSNNKPQTDADGPSLTLGQITQGPARSAVCESLRLNKQD